MAAKLHMSGDVVLVYHIEVRLAELWNISKHWWCALDSFNLDRETWMRGSETPSYLRVVEPQSRITGDLNNGDNDDTEGSVSSGSEVSIDTEEQLLELLEEEIRRQPLEGMQEAITMSGGDEGHQYGTHDSQDGLVVKREAIEQQANVPMTEVALKAAIAKLEHAKVLVVRGEHVAWDIILADEEPESNEPSARDMGGEEEGDSWHVEDALLLGWIKDGGQLHAAQLSE
ncbi:hypothetical protein M422DRAFT_272303 [Sphaerobolus stellatus SS14]|uniref:Uncharacterized protein n=1 Tax=Sphaerobolus stellatus (strain SS14) TaxID=990650 RepID=A0A0C9TXS0_SPHS4|nr:hypothetical protein M422DRAFT_272303 [Sphaerobolus stellatus SS14]